MNNNNGGGFNIKISGTSTILQIILILLKAFRLIDWPWIWVFFPLWGSILLVCVILIILFIIAKCNSK